MDEGERKRAIKEGKERRFAYGLVLLSGAFLIFAYDQFLSNTFTYDELKFINAPISLHIISYVPLAIILYLIKIGMDWADKIIDKKNKK